MDQGRLAPCPKTVGDVSTRNNSRTRRVKSGNIRGICSVDVLTCHARADHTDSGTMRCVPCRLAWDVSDPEPPPCRVRGDLTRQHDYEKLKFT